MTGIPKQSAEWKRGGKRVLPWAISALLLIGLGAVMPLQPLAQATDPDLNNDGTVTGQDVAMVARCKGHNPQNTPNCQFAIADTDGDGDVDNDDLQFVVDHLGETGFPTGENVVPLAVAGPDHTVLVGETVSLDGSASTDADGDPLTYLWTFTSLPTGSTATLSDATGVTPTFVPDLTGTYVVQLMVNDGTVDSVPDSVSITTTNSQPVVEAGADQSVQVTDVVQLDGSGSSDVDGDPLTFLWELSAKPAGSTATLSNPTLVNPTFVVDLPGTYVVLLTVNDGTSDSDVDFLTITTVNSAPVANAGPDQTVFVTQPALLDGSGSQDVDHDSLTFAWSFMSAPTGSTAILSDSSSPTPDFTVDLPGTYVVQLVVNDGTVDSAADTVVINTQNSAPVAQAGPDQLVAKNATVQLDGSHSRDVDGDPLTFQWAITTLPTGSTATLSDAQAALPTFVADLIGLYVVQLIVNDGTDDSAPSTVTIAANTLPLAEAGPDQLVEVGVLVALDGTGSSDADGQPLTFLWTLTTQPAGSTTVLSDPTVAQPTFLADAPGSYTATLVVNDGEQDSDPDLVTITTLNNPPVANAGADQTVGLGTTVQLNGSGSSDPDGDLMAYQWNVLSVPVGSIAVLSDATLVNPTFVADLPGIYGLALITNDGTVESAPDTVFMTVANPVPTLSPIGNQTVVLGQTLALTLTGSDPNGDPLSFGATTVPLPANMTLNGTTGELLFHPDESQVGVFTLTLFVSDGLSTDEETITLTVQGPAPGGITAMQGRILDTHAFVNGGTEVPVVGATVRFLGTGLSVISDSQGFFTLSGLPSGTQVLDIDASTANAGPGGVAYASFREQLTLLTNVTNVEARPFFLPHVDPDSVMTVNGIPVTQVDPNNTTVVSNAVLGVSITIPAHTAKKSDGTDYAGTLTISEVPEALAPAALPDTLDPGLLITIQPPGVLFTTPAAITFPNVDQGLPGDQVNLWSLDPATGLFRIVGQLEVSADGTTLETVSGGVIATDWFCPCPPSPSGGGTGGGIGGGGSGGGGIGGGAGDVNMGGNPNAQPGNPNPQNKNPDPDKCGTGSSTSLCGGELTVRHQLPSYQSMGAARGLTFIYKHGHADPQPILFNNPTIPLGAQTPLTMSARLAVAGVDQGLEVYTDTSGLTEKADRPLRQVVQFDANALSTGSYPYSLTLTNHYLASNIGTRVGATVLVRNERESVFGAGWTLAGFDRLHEQANGDVMVTTGTGGALLFQQPQVGTFASLQTEDMPGNILVPTQVFVHDLNQDTIPDIVSGSRGSFQVYLGTGDGTVSLHGAFPQGGVSGAHQMADFDQDGFLDMVNLSSNSAAISYGDGFGNFVDLTVHNFPAGVATTSGSLVVGDWNEDGWMDFAFPNSIAGLTLYLGQGGRGSGAFVPQPILNALNFLGGPGAADFDLDGHLDLVTANNSNLTLFHGDGAGNFSLALTLANMSQALELTVGDWNDDGYPDVATSGITGPNTKGVLIFENNRVGGLWPTQVVDLGLPNALNGVTHLEPGDVDNDGRLELLVSSNDASNTGAIQVLVWEDGPGFVLNSVIPAGFWAQAVTTGDLDQDGQTDLVSNNGRFSDTTELLTFRNLGAEDGYRSPVGDFSTLTKNPDSTFTRRLKDGTTMQFDAQGRQTTLTDRNGNTTTYVYDAQGRLEKIVDPVNLETVLDYGGGTHLTKITDPVGRETVFDIDTAGDLTKITDPDLTTREFTYDPRHRLVQQQSKRGFFTQYEYNFAGRHVKATRPDTSTRQVFPGEMAGLVDPTSGLGTANNPASVVPPTDVVATFTDSKGQVASFKTDALGNATVHMDPLGRTTTISRNFHGDPVVTTNPNGAMTRRIYDERGNVLSLIEVEGLPEERTTTFEYDPVFNLVTKMTDPAGKETTIIRDPANGNPLQVIKPLLDERLRTFRADGQVDTDTDENGESTTFTYDPLTGNLATIVDAEVHTTRFVRDAAGQVITLIEGEGTTEQRIRTFTYDAMNRLKTATDGTANPPMQFRYDEQGNLKETELATGEIETRTYDPLNRVATIDDPLRGRSTFVYDLNGNLEQTVNAAGDPTAFAYDVANQLKMITDALTGVQAFTYDVEGNVETFTDARQKTTTFMYDTLNRQKMRIAHGGTFTTTFTYDTRDNLIDTVDPKTQLIHRIYDDLSRLTDIQTPDNTVGIHYDKVGNPTDVTDNDSQVTFTYDGLNRVQTALTSQTSGLQPQVLLTSVYDAVGNRRQLDEDTGASITNYVYDLAGRLTTLTPPVGPAMAVTLGYDPAGRLASIAYPNGVNTAYEYGTKGRLDSLSHTLGANPSFASFGYTYNPVGNILAILDQVMPTENRTHTYDALQRLKSGGTTDNAETYDYDLVGNRTTSFLSSTHNHDDLNRLLEDDSFTYTYDNNGNLATKTNKATPTEVTTYHWDAQDQLIQIDRPDSTTVTYKYDGLGRRIEKNVAGTLTRYVYDGEDILLEYDGPANTFVARYSHGDQVDQPLVLQKAGVGFFYYHSNHQGSITHLTDSSGTIANSYIYDSYGRQLTVFESVIQPFSYTGREYDGESGLYFYRARYFDAQTGRFLSEDPIGFDAGDQNLYRYVSNNPPNFRDPSGTILIAPLIFEGLRRGATGAAADLAEQLLENGGNTDCLDFGRAAKAGLRSLTDPTGGLGKTAKLVNKVTKPSLKRIQNLIKKLSRNERRDDGLSQEKVNKLRRMVERAGGKIRNDGTSGVRGSSAGVPHIQAEGIGGGVKGRHIWTQGGVQ